MTENQEAINLANGMVDAGYTDIRSLSRFNEIVLMIAPSVHEDSIEDAWNEYKAILNLAPSEIVT